MDTVIRSTGLLFLALLVTCGINTLLMEWHIVPKLASGRTGVLITPVTGKVLKPDRRDGQYPDFWYADNAPC